MFLTHKALWIIERNLGRDLSLSEIAGACGVSEFHLAHAFSAAAGAPVMRYVRARRLTQAAYDLAGGAPNILSTALDAGYASHEAFTRAFRDQFGLTPEAVRRRASLDGLPTVPALILGESDDIQIEAPGIVAAKAMRVAGLAGRVSPRTIMDVPAMWRDFVADIDDIGGRAGPIPIGVSHDDDEDGGFEYLCGVEVTDFSRTPARFSRLNVPPRTYAVFQHPGHVAGLGDTYRWIWNTWLPGESHLAADAPRLERHQATFDPRTGQGGLEIWIPLET